MAAMLCLVCIGQAKKRPEPPLVWQTGTLIRMEQARLSPPTYCYPNCQGTVVSVRITVKADAATIQAQLPIKDGVLPHLTFKPSSDGRGTTQVPFAITQDKHLSYNRYGNRTGGNDTFIKKHRLWIRDEDGLVFVFEVLREDAPAFN
jgi:hypothetical protein